MKITPFGFLSFFLRLLSALSLLLLTSCQILSADDESLVSEESVNNENSSEQASTMVSISQTEETPLPVTQSGVLELRLQMWAGSGQECVRAYPFSIREEEGRILLTGDGQVQMECAFANEYCEDTCRTLHIDYALDTRIDGEILLDEEGASAYQVDLYLFFDGQLKEYFTDFPPEVSVQYTESSPMIENAGDLVSVSMPYQDGAVAVLLQGEPDVDPDQLPVLPAAAIWTLTLHLP